MNNQRGFTIIELIVVIAIIAILASIVIPAAGSAKNRARIAKASAQIAALEMGITAFESDFGFYPTKQDLTSSPASESNNSDIIELLTGFTYSGSGATATKTASSHALVTDARWNGPYMDLDASETNSGALVDPWRVTFTMGLDLDGDPSTSPPGNNVYTFDITSAGPDETVGTADDITNF